MRDILPKNLPKLAKNCPVPLYIVGGSVRDFLAGISSPHKDWDICAPLPADDFARLAAENGLQVKSVYNHTGTVKLRDPSGEEYEYTCFRSDKYVRGVHTPAEISFTSDISLDARRRDFTVNAVYYDIGKDRYEDPLDGISAIGEKRLTTVAAAEKVFGEDGLRLMRLARQAAQLGFTPDEECLAGATQNAALIGDISAERVYAELSSILTADERYGVKDGHYRGLKLLDQTRVLDRILPELTLGRNMPQRADFHRHDVLEHSLRAALYAPPSLRLAALLHDVGKPFCKLRDGNSYEHPAEGAALAKQILARLKAPKRITERVCALIEWHMYDFDCRTREPKLRRFLVAHAPLLDELLLLKQADYSACADDLSPAPTCVRWQTLLGEMRAKNTPFSVGELAVNGKDLQNAGIRPDRLSEILHALLLHTATKPSENRPDRLLKLAAQYDKSLT